MTERSITSLLREKAVTFADLAREYGASPSVAKWRSIRQVKAQIDALHGANKALLSEAQAIAQDEA
jgi:transposase-like protein